MGGCYEKRWATHYERGGRLTAAKPPLVSHMRFFGWAAVLSDVGRVPQWANLMLREKLRINFNSIYRFRLEIYNKRLACKQRQVLSLTCTIFPFTLVWFMVTSPTPIKAEFLSNDAKDFGVSRSFAALFYTTKKKGLCMLRNTAFYCSAIDQFNKSIFPMRWQLRHSGLGRVFDHDLHHVEFELSCFV